MNLQGRLLDDLQDPLLGPVNLEVTIFNGIVGGIELYSEDHLGVQLDNGVFSIVIGTGSSSTGTFDASTFTTLNAYLEIAVNGEPLSPRQPFNTNAYSYQAEFAVDADTVDGMDASSLDQSGHVSDTGNPHNVTASQVGAATSSSVASSIAAHAGNPSAHHVKTSQFSELGGQIADSQVPSAITRDSELNSGLAGKANVSHNHSAANIVSGTLSTSRFDAYSDLSVSGRLDNTSSADILTRGQADSRFRTRYSRFTASCTTRSSYGPSYVKIGNIGSFFKSRSDTDAKVTFHGRLYVGNMSSGTGARFQLRVDDIAPFSGGAALVRSNEDGNSAGVPNSMTAIYTSLSSGTHTVSLWVQGTSSGSGTSARCDPGVFNTDHVVVTETF